MYQTAPYLLEYAQGKGSPVELKSNCLLQISEATFFFVVERGHAAAFLCTIRADGTEGARHLIHEYAEGAVIFPLPSADLHEGFAVKIIALKPVLLKKLSFAGIQNDFAQNKELVQSFCDQLELSLAPFQHLLEKEKPQKLSGLLTVGKTVSLPKGERYGLSISLDPSARKKVCWIQVRKGGLFLLGNPHWRIGANNGVFPLVEHCWFEAAEESEVAVIETKTAVENGEWKKAIDHFLAFFVDFQSETLRARNLEESLRLKAKEREEEQRLRETLKGVLALFYKSKSLKVTIEAVPLFKACQLLGAYQEIQFVLPENLAQAGEIHQQLAEICAASKLRYRPVKLEGKWWKKDCGHLLCFYESRLNPVVLISKSLGEYVLIDPETMQMTQIDSTVAAQLSAQAFMFYEPIPENIRSGWGMLAYYLKASSRDVVKFIAYSIIAATISLFTPFAAWALFNAIIPLVETALLWQLSMGLILTGISMSLFYFFKSLILVRTRGLIFNQFQLGIWDRFLKLPVSFSRRFSTGSLFTRIFAADQMQDELNDNVLRILFSGIFALFYIIMMVLYSPGLTLGVMGVFVLFACVTAGCLRAAIKKEGLVQEMSSSINGFLIQIIRGISKLRIAGAERHAFVCWAKDFIKQKKWENQIQNCNTIAAIATSILPIFAFLILFFLVIYVMDVETQEFLGFNVAFSMLLAALIDFSTGIMQLSVIKPLWKRAQVVLQESPEDVVNKNKPGKLTGEISVESVDFRYSPETPLVLRDVTIRAYPSEFIAIVGSSGSGKSTLLRMLLGFEKPEKGAVYYDRRDISSLDMHDVRKQIGVVLQEGGIAEGSIYDNIACGGIYTTDQIEKALERSGFQEELEKLPMGLHTYLPVNGETLSGGQRQRLLLARALLREPRILFLDEATSALDNAAQEKISARIAELEVTRIVISHRLSTIKNADRIYVMEQGKVVDAGSFNELSTRDGLFKRMLERQKL